MHVTAELNKAHSMNMIYVYPAMVGGMIKPDFSTAGVMIKQGFHRSREGSSYL
jgi:hypothetical protein